MSVKETLLNAADLIEDHWMASAFAAVIDGKPCYCAAGAILRIEGTIQEPTRPYGLDNGWTASDASPGVQAFGQWLEDKKLQRNISLYPHDPNRGRTWNVIDFSDPSNGQEVAEKMREFAEEL